MAVACTRETSMAVPGPWTSFPNDSTMSLAYITSTSVLLRHNPLEDNPIILPTGVPLIVLEVESRELR